MRVAGQGRSCLELVARYIEENDDDVTAEFIRCNRRSEQGAVAPLEGRARQDGAALGVMGQCNQNTVDVGTFRTKLRRFTTCDSSVPSTVPETVTALGIPGTIQSPVTCRVQASTCVASECSQGWRSSSQSGVPERCTRWGEVEARSRRGRGSLGEIEGLEAMPRRGIGEE